MKTAQKSPTSHSRFNLPWVTLIFLFYSIFVYFVYKPYTMTGNLYVFLLISENTYPDGLVEVKHGEYWRLLTPVFLHFSWDHITYNVIGVLILGNWCEKQIGSLWYLLLITLIGVMSNYAEYYFYGPSFGGLSGILYGLLGFIITALLMTGQLKKIMPWYFLLIFAAVFILSWTGIFDDKETANMAHTGGLVSGIIFGFLVGAYFRVKQSMHSNARP